MRTAISALRWTLGVVILTQSFVVLLNSRAGQTIHSSGVPNLVRYILAWTEMVGSALFLLPPTLIVGGWTLFGVFCVAVAAHLVHGEFNVGGLFIYGAAVLVVLAHRAVGSEA